MRVKFVPRRAMACWRSSSFRITATRVPCLVCPSGAAPDRRSAVPRLCGWLPRPPYRGPGAPCRGRRARPGNSVVFRCPWTRTPDPPRSRVPFPCPRPVPIGPPPGWRQSALWYRGRCGRDRHVGSFPRCFPGPRSPGPVSQPGRRRTGSGQGCQMGLAFAV